MRTSTSVAALALAFLQTTTALNSAVQRKYNLLADMGLNPDGSSMDLPAVDNPAIDIGSLKALKATTASDDQSVSITAAEKILPEYVKLPLDNFAKDKNQDYSYHGSFFNRFWVAESSYKTGGPVFIYDVGEANAESNALFRLQNETSFFKQMVDSYGGIGIVWEHRYYGNSTPEPIDINTPPEAFRFLTTEQSLADVDRFAKQFARKNINYTLTPDKTPWVFVGGSYPAMRAAFMRDQYPETIYASYASSAPVQASVDQSFYFEPIWRGLNKYGFGNCSRDIQAATRYMDRIMDKDHAGAAKLKEQFLGRGAAKNSHATFADALTTIFATWQSYGVESGVTGLRRFCDWIETDPDTRTLAPAEGWAKSKGANFTVARWATYPWFAANVNNLMETECSGKANVTGNCDLDRKFTDPASIAWTWQYCTQWGYFQSANLGPNQLVSKYNSLHHQHDICHRQFPTAPRSLLPDWPNVDRTNAVFGGWNIRPSNTYWSNGEFDPWRTLSPASAEPFAPKGVKRFTDAPKCGEKQSHWELFGYVLPDAQHCYDFRTTFAGGAISRQYFTTALTKWLKCFKPRGGKPGRPWRA
ncbi:peptidase S28 [Cucurbitaria berberidis CBS 394.84]|uniref:Peptidase S28 n=1 Tax=Cucurbitaria berberidis CBS 394.84 TaxID=1168544 RepID=A0A9P4GHH0_9PLEO|nr:peptidase S28 [Cucurbitaria berberidis CBS 394.84]KAF1846223.1 peptidase S28 [Cucurbitaria berberidis CBS 394.84]